MEKLFILGGMDAEMKTIADIISKTEGVKALDSNLFWYNATYENLSDEIKGAVNLALANGTPVYGLELRGNMEGVINIDHHKYEDEDRYNEKATIEQVAEILGLSLTPFEIAVALNDKGFIPLMQKAGVDAETISKVRRLDRECQGITPEMENEAEECLKNKYVIGDLTVVCSSHSKSSCYTDRLFGAYTKLLVISKDEFNFFGSSIECEKLFNTFGGWSGGTAPNGFWGISFSDKPENLVKEWKQKYEIMKYFGL